mgnify:FL=1
MLWCERAENKGTSHDKRKQDGGCETEKLWSHGAIFLVPISRLPIIRPSKYTLTDKNGARGDEWTAKLPFRRGDANAIQLSFQISYMQCAYTFIGWSSHSNLKEVTCVQELLKGTFISWSKSPCSSNNWLSYACGNIFPCKYSEYAF